MTRQLDRARRGPLVAVAVVTLLLCLFVLQLPGVFLDQLQRARPLTETQSGWVYRLLAVAAAAQAIYGGYGVLRVERLRRAREKDPRLEAMAAPQLLRSMSRTAAAMVAMTLVYGTSALLLTGERGGFWLFPLLAAAQGGWYLRALGVVRDWLIFQPAASSDDGLAYVWRREPPDYCPTIARGLGPATPRRELRDA